jgi:hypothetical protein
MAEEGANISGGATSRRQVADNGFDDRWTSEFGGGLQNGFGVRFMDLFFIFNQFLEVVI